MGRSLCPTTDTRMLLYVLVTMFLTLSSQVWGWDYDPTPSNLNDPTPRTLNDPVYFVIGPLPQLRGDTVDGEDYFGGAGCEYWSDPVCIWRQLKNKIFG